MMNTVYFVIPPYHKRRGSSTIFPLGIGYLISSLRSHSFSCRTIDFTEKMNDIDEEITQSSIECSIRNFIEFFQEPLFWGIGPITTASSAFLEWIVHAIRLFSQRPIICGGPLPSIFGQRWLFFDYLKVDGIIMGDGEDAIVELAKHISCGLTIDSCSRVVTSRKPDYYNIITNIDAIPFPYRKPANASLRRRILTPPVATMITMRGCPYHCYFCVSGNLRGKQNKFCKRSNESIISELIFLQESGYHSVIYYDDCLFFGKNVNDDIQKFCMCLQQNHIHMEWSMELRPDSFEILDNLTLYYLSSFGCKEINVGFESSNKNLQTLFSKSYNTDRVLAQCHTCMDLGIAITGTFIIGGPRETNTTIRNTINFSSSLGLLFAHFTPLEVYPGTPLYAEKFGSDDKMWFKLLSDDNRKWNEIIYENSVFSANDLLQFASEAYRNFYLNALWTDRIKKFFDKNTAKSIIAESVEMVANRYNL